MKKKKKKNDLATELWPKLLRYGQLAPELKCLPRKLINGFLEIEEKKTKDGYKTGLY